MVSQGCVGEDKKATKPATWPQPQKRSMPTTVAFEPLFAKSPQTPFTGQHSPAAWRVCFGGKSNGGMGLGQDHWKKASPGPGRLPCGASRTAKPACAAQRACRGSRKIGCLGTGRTKGRCGARPRIAQRWNCRQGLKITRLIFKGALEKQLALARGMSQARAATAKIGHWDWGLRVGIITRRPCKSMPQRDCGRSPVRSRPLMVHKHLRRFFRVCW
jgi:hypothetical protein